MERVKNKEKDKKNIEEQLKECQEIKEEYLNGWKRAKADFLNYKKEEAIRLEEFACRQKADFVLKLLPVLDNFYIAESKLPAELKDNQWVEGLIRIKKQIVDFLKSQGVVEIQSLGRKFDPNFHEAIEKVEGKGAEAGIIIEEIKKGYLFQGRVLRPAQVKVAK
jgi:molecular chaperone GrpE